ncbi:MAG: TetR/AcrR family transcriptional regulator [Glaciihabitans sp.]|nr:TetR/AcrR family transcriptional regulator [Glaciihabitans sp.]
MSAEASIPIPRMASDERRELVLKAATEVFGQRGYAGTTTDQVAAAAGVSQPYVVRIFGTKEKLFLAVLQRALDVMMVAFRQALSEEPELPVSQRMGRAYVDLLQDRGLLLSLMHGFVLGADPEIGRVARCGFLEVYKFLKAEAGLGSVEAAEFLAHGMLLNTLVGIRMTDEYDTNPDAREMLEGSLGAKLPLLLALDHTRTAS